MIFSSSLPQIIAEPPQSSTFKRAFIFPMTAAGLKRTLLSVATTEAPSNWPLLITLAGIQFAHVLDFVIVMPLGPQLMRELSIAPREFGLLVSAYNIAAAVAGVCASFLIDRFDRRSVLVGVCAGFSLGTLACGVVPHALHNIGYEFLLSARTLTGIFGGLLQAVIFTIIGDCFSEKQRGTATGTVMSAFSIASIFGIPLGLFLATKYDWRAPFLLLAALGIALTVTAHRTLPSLKNHLPIQLPRRGTWLSLLRERNSQIAFALIVFLMFAGFSVVPFIGAFLVRNVGFREEELASVFFVGGLATLLTTRTIGIIADRFGKRPVFTWLAGLSIIPVLALTNLHHVPELLAIAVTTLVTVLISARAIPALAMITSSIDRARRGRFLSLTSSVQQASSGVASFVAGSLLGKGPHGEITNYNLAGAIAVVATGLAIVTARKLNSTQGT